MRFVCSFSLLSEEKSFSRVSIVYTIYIYFVCVKLLNCGLLEKEHENVAWFINEMVKLSEKVGGGNSIS